MLERLSVIRLIGCFKASLATSNLIGIKPYGMPGGGWMITLAWRH